MNNETNISNDPFSIRFQFKRLDSCSSIILSFGMNTVLRKLQPREYPNQMEETLQKNHLACVSQCFVLSLCCVCATKRIRKQDDEDQVSFLQYNDGDKFYAWTNRVILLIDGSLTRSVHTTTLMKLMITFLFPFVDLCYLII